MYFYQGKTAISGRKRNLLQIFLVFSTSIAFSTYFSHQTDTTIRLNGHLNPLLRIYILYEIFILLSWNCLSEYAFESVPILFDLSNIAKISQTS